MRTTTRFLFLGLLAVLGAATPSWAWEGRLVLDDGEPVAGATVRAIGRATSATTGGDGRFVLSAAAAPPVTLLIELADHRVVVLDVAGLDGSGPTRLVVDLALNEEIETFAPVETELEASPGALASSVDLRRARERGDLTLQRALEAVPSTPPRSFDPDAVPALRGLSRGRTLVLVDGAPVTPERRAGFSGASFVPGTLGRLDVARGPNGVLFGSAAIGGVVALSSPWASPNDPTRHAEATFQGLAGDVDAGRVSVRWKDDGWSAALGAARQSDPMSADGTELEGGFEQRSAFVGRSWQSAGTLMRLGVRHDGLDDADRLALASDSRRTIVPDDATTRVSFRADRPGEGFDTSLTAWASDTERATSSSARGDGFRFALGTRTTQTDAGARVSLHGGGRSRWTAGGRLWARFDTDVVNSFDLGERDLDVPGAESPLEDGRQISASAFGFLVHPLSERLTAHLGARIERVRSDAETISGDLSESAWATSWSAAASWQVSARSNVTLQASGGYREPLLTERYLTGATGRGLAFANADLDAESSLQWDLAWRTRWDGGHLQAAAFRADVNDIVEREALAEDEVPAAIRPLPFFKYRFANRGEAEIEGVELLAAVRLGASTWMRWSAHVVEGEDGEGVPLSEMPGRAVTASVSTAFGERWSGTTSLRFQARDDEVGSGEVERGSFALLDLGVGVRISEHVHVGVGVRNALDDEYFVSADEGDPLAPGRTGVVTLRLRP